jgi:hypothetical protein
MSQIDPLFCLISETLKQFNGGDRHGATY